MSSSDVGSYELKRSPWMQMEECSAHLARSTSDGSADKSNNNNDNNNDINNLNTRIRIIILSLRASRRPGPRVHRSLLEGF